MGKIHYNMSSSKLSPWAMLKVTLSLRAVAMLNCMNFRFILDRAEV